VGAFGCDAAAAVSKYLRESSKFTGSSEDDERHRIDEEPRQERHGIMMKVFARQSGVVLTGVLFCIIAGHEGSAAPKDVEAGGVVAERNILAKREPKQPDGRKPQTKAEDPKGVGKPEQVGSFGDWGAYVAHGGKEKTCYALGRPKDRAPSGLNRDPAYVFISTRPGEKVREEVSVIMGFPLKEDGGSKAEVGGAVFELVAKGANAWIKNQADDAKFVEALKKGSKLVVRAASVRGRVTTDTYSLAGVGPALEKVAKECQ
jgi:hypothetical protein